VLGQLMGSAAKSQLAESANASPAHDDEVHPEPAAGLEQSRYRWSRYLQRMLAVE
jgi:hypothetical protein